MSHPFLPPIPNFPPPQSGKGGGPLVAGMMPRDPAPAPGINFVEDGRPGMGGAIRTAAEVLGPLDATDLALLRRAGHLARRDGGALFHCAVCGAPVHVRVLGVRSSGKTGGRRAFFVHDPRIGARSCPCGCLSDGSSPAAIDARRFDGKQEGQRHAYLKFLLQDSLERDPVFSTVTTEQVVRRDGDWRKPDVLAQTPWGLLGFDVQLAAPLLTSILGRERFYAGAGLGHCWIVDAADPDRLQRQGFQDVILPQGAAVFGFDEQAAAITADTGVLTLHLMTLSEQPARGCFFVSSELIGRDVILDLAGMRRRDSAPMAADLRAAALFLALREGDADGLRTRFAALAEGTGAPGWDEARGDALPRLLTTLGTLVTGRKADASRFDDTAVNAIVNQFLRPEQAGSRPNVLARAWAPVIARAGYHPVRPDLARQARHPDPCVA